MDMTPYLALQTVMMPRDENPQGTIFGGVILGMIDMSAYTAAKRLVMKHGGEVPMLVTVAVNKVEFKKPVLVGDVVRCLVSPVRFGRTSLTVKVLVEAERGLDTISVTEAELVFVRVDSKSTERKPIPLFPEGKTPT